MKKRILILSALAVMSCSLVVSSDTHAQSNEPPSVVNPLKKHEPVIEESAKIVEKTEEQLKKEAEEAEALAKRKESLSSELEKMKQEIEEMKRLIAEKKAADELRAQQAQIPVVNTVSAGPAPQATVAQAPVSIFRGNGGPNAYGWGWCTWWVKEKRPDIGGYWGNANQWLGSAQAAGYSTGSTPVAGAIGFTAAGPYGHVVYVESTSGGMVNISEMGWNYTQGVSNYRTVPASDFYYIY